MRLLTFFRHGSTWKELTIPLRDIKIDQIIGCGRFSDVSSIRMLKLTASRSIKLIILARLRWSYQRWSILKRTNELKCSNKKLLAIKTSDTKTWSSFVDSFWTRLHWALFWKEFEDLHSTPSYTKAPLKAHWTSTMLLTTPNRFVRYHLLWKVG